jgi:hypothetical protein
LMEGRKMADAPPQPRLPPLPLPAAILGMFKEKGTCTLTRVFSRNFPKGGEGGIYREGRSRPHK